MSNVKCSGKNTNISAEFILKGSIDTFSLMGHQFEIFVLEYFNSSLEWFISNLLVCLQIIYNQRVKIIVMKFNSDRVKTEFNTSCGERQQGRGWYTGNHQHRSNIATS